MTLEVIEDDYRCVHVLDDIKALDAISWGNLTNMRKYEMMFMAVRRRYFLLTTTTGGQYVY